MTKQRVRSDGTNPFEKSRQRQEARKAKENALQTEAVGETNMPAASTEKTADRIQEQGTESMTATPPNMQNKPGKKMTRREYLQQVREQARQDTRPNPLTDLMQTAAEKTEDDDDEITTFTMRLSVRDKKVLEAYARKQNMSMSGVILTMITYLEKDVDVD